MNCMENFGNAGAKKLLSNPPLDQLGVSVPDVPSPAGVGQQLPRGSRPTKRAATRIRWYSATQGAADAHQIDVPTAHERLGEADVGIVAAEFHASRLSFWSSVPCA